MLHVHLLLMNCTWHLFTHMLFLHVHMWYLFTCMSTIHVHALSITWSHMRHSSMCNMVCCHYENPTSAPIGDPSMVRLPWACRSMLFWHAGSSCSYTPYNFHHETLTSVGYAKLLLVILS